MKLILEDNNFKRDAIVLSCLSLYLEVFGHILISLISILGYYIYMAQKKYLVYLVVFTMVSNYARENLGKYGKSPFTEHIAPKMKKVMSKSSLP